MRRALAMLVLLCLFPIAVHGAETSQPDIIVILTDDMRADDWPMLDDTRRLVGGTWFPNFIFNTPLCCPFRASFQLGQMAHNTGIKRNNDGDLFRRLDDDTLATAINAAGYYTVYVGKYMNNYTGPAPGWDAWLGDSDHGGNRYQRDGVYITDALTDDAVTAILEAPSNKPLFLMLGHLAPHEPWKPDEKYADVDAGPTINRDDADRKRTLLSVDDSTEAIAAAMGGRWDEACVVVLTDNGYLLGEHGTRAKSHWWDEASRVPMLIRCPGIGGGVDARLASTVDVPATLLDAAGASMRHGLDGRLLQDAWSREGVLVESWVRGSDGHRRVPFRAIKGDGWIYVEAKGKAPRYFTMPEGRNEINTLSDAEKQRLADWLKALERCAGETCG